MKRGDPGRAEDQVLMRALRDFNIPKIVTDDLPVFMGLIGDLFPALDVPRKRDLNFEKVRAHARPQRQQHPRPGRSMPHGWRWPAQLAGLPGLCQLPALSTAVPADHQAGCCGAEAAGGGELRAEGGAAGGAAASQTLRLCHWQHRLRQVPGSGQTVPEDTGSPPAPAQNTRSPRAAPRPRCGQGLHRSHLRRC